MCLVRGRPSEARARLHEALATTGIDPGRFAHRLDIVSADLARPMLGLEPGTAAALADRADAICHAGATVNWVQSYRSLRAANVAGTLELLRIAARRGTPFHFVSSLSVCYSTTAPQSVDETYDPLPDLAGLHLGYAQTKVVAETLVREAGRRGLAVAIYRPSLISGHSESGAFNRDDILARVVSGLRPHGRGAGSRLVARLPAGRRRRAAHRPDRAETAGGPPRAPPTARLA